MQETRVRTLGREDPLEEEMETHSSILAWKIPWTEEPGRLQSMGLQRIRHSLVTKQQQQWPDSWLPPEKETPENTRKSLIRFQK